MSKKLILLAITIFVVTTIFISGCITNKENSGNKNETIKSDIIPSTNLPSGITFLASHETNIEIGNSSKPAIEGIYKTDQNEDVYVQVYESTSPVELLNEYKSQYNNMSYNPFAEVTFNGHNATEVTFYSTSDGNSVPKYNIIWTNNNSMIKVGPSTDIQKVRNLAAATNN